MKYLLCVLCAISSAAHAATAAADCPKKLADKPDPYLEMVANTLVVYQACSMGDADFDITFKPLYQEWRTKYRDAIARYERDPRARRYVECGLEHEKQRAAADTAAGRADKKQVCHSMIGPGIQRFIEKGPR